MAARTQALLIQAVALFVANFNADGGHLLAAVVASCSLFWVTFFLLFLSHRCHVTRFDLFFLRWGTIPFVLVGAPIIEPFSGRI